MKRVVIWILSLTMLVLWISPIAASADVEELSEYEQLIVDLWNDLAHLDSTQSPPDQATHQRAQQLAAQIFSDPDSYSRFIGEMTVDHGVYPTEKEISDWLWSGFSFYTLQLNSGLVYSSHIFQFMQNPEIFYRAMCLFPEELQQQAISILKAPDTVYNRIDIVYAAQAYVPGSTSTTETMENFSLFIEDIRGLTADDYHTFFTHFMSDSAYDYDTTITSGSTGRYAAILFDIHPDNFVLYLSAEDAATIQFIADKLALNHLLSNSTADYISSLDEVIFNSSTSETNSTALQLCCAALAKVSYYYDDFYQNYSTFLVKHFYADPQLLLYLSDYGALSSGIGFALIYDTTANGCKQALEVIEELMATLPETSPRYVFLKKVCATIEENMPTEFDALFSAFQNSADIGSRTNMLLTLKEKPGEFLTALGQEEQNFIATVGAVLPQYLNSDDSITVAEYHDILVSYTGDGLYLEHQKDTALILLTELIHQKTDTLRFYESYSQAIKNCFTYAPDLLFAGVSKKDMKEIFDGLFYDLSMEDFQMLREYCLSQSADISSKDHYLFQLLDYMNSPNMSNPNIPSETTQPTESTTPTHSGNTPAPTEPAEIPHTPVKIWVIVYEVVIVLAFIAVVIVIVVRDRKKFNAEEELQEE